MLSRVFALSKELRNVLKMQERIKSSAEGHAEHFVGVV